MGLQNNCCQSPLLLFCSQRTHTVGCKCLHCLFILQRYRLFSGKNSFQSVVLQWTESNPTSLPAVMADFSNLPLKLIFLMIRKYINKTVMEGKLAEIPLRDGALESYFTAVFLSEVSRKWSIMSTALPDCQLPGSLFSQE